MDAEKHLVLNRYLLSLFGFNGVIELQTALAGVDPGVGTDGWSRFITVLAAQKNLNRDRLTEEALLGYDENIRGYVNRINFKRDPVTLKYFQYMAVLFTEIVLDSMKNRTPGFLHEINEYYYEYSKENGVEFPTPFSEKDLHKIAFWMATGAGKTLITHINYYQFFHYKLFDPDGIILLTPNEGLSRQHYDELLISGIPARLYSGSNPRYHGTIRDGHEVLVMEITKLVGEKKGGGVTVPISVFEGRNLVFVDEGHKGRRSEDQKWAQRRDLLAQDGFVFEYSATFGQILSEKNPAILAEYGKSIIFDYSYRYFYLDGYGKDFSILNVRKDTSVSQKHFQETMLVASILSYYEQLLAYEQNKREAMENNLEKPLLVFVGTTVTGKNENSDVIQIIDFLARILREPAWLEGKINQILNRETGLDDEDGKDVFHNRFKYLKKSFSGHKTDLIEDVYFRIFGGRGKFSIYELRNTEGELGLKVGETPYFGVVNIGNVLNLKRGLEKIGIEVGLDAISSSLFHGIKSDDSKINILLGSKKFIEGWDTWRVTTMGLLNIGTGQGPQIVQLFGRGIRLKGKEMSLQRSGETGTVKLLETLNIYGIKADYLTRFLEAINKEDVDFETIEVPVFPQKEDKWKGLYTLTEDHKRRFENEEVLFLEMDKLPYAKLNLLPKVYAYLAAERKKGGVAVAEVKGAVRDIVFPEKYVHLLDWQEISEEIYRFKEQKGYWNLVFSQSDLKKILTSERCRLAVLPEVLQVFNEDDISRIQEIGIMVIKKLLESYYLSNARRFCSKHMTYEKLDLKHFKQMSFSVSEEVKEDGKAGYVLQIDKKKKELINNIRKLVDELGKNLELLLEKEGLENGELPRIYYDRHLFAPLLLKNNKIDKMSPVGLEESEKDFVLGLIDYLKNNPELLNVGEVYLFRNLPKSGVGFFNLSGFYPDFILWLKQKDRQLIAFIDPKGLQHDYSINNEKIQLHKDIKNIENAKKSEGWKNIKLESFILSATSYSELIKKELNLPSKEKYRNNHVIFMEDKDWQKQLISSITESLI